jgi:FolB domain-containing protein
MLIRIRKLRISAFLGVYERERLATREIVVNARIEYDSALAAANDLIQQAVDYEQICATIVEVVTNSRYRLIEALSNSIVERLACDDRIVNVELEVEKPNAMAIADVSVITNWKRSTGTPEK